MLLVAAGQGDIFQQFGGDRGEAAELRCTLARTSRYWPLAAASGRAGSLTRRGLYCSCQFAEDERHEQLLTNSGEELLGRIGEQVGLVLLGLGYGGGQRAFEMLGIGVGKKQPLAERSGFAGNEGVGFAGPSRRQRLRGVEHVDVEEKLD